MKKLIAYVLLAMVTLACSKENRWACLKSNGKEISQLRSLPGFVRVEVHNKITVNIYQGGERKVEVVAGEHIINNIKTVVEDNVLKITDENTCNFVRGYKHIIKVNVTVPYLEKATNNGVGPLSFDAGFSQDSISVRAENSGDIYINGSYGKIQTSSHGNGDIYINGNCRQLNVYAYGTNFLQAYNLRVSDYIFIANLSLGDCNINAANTGLVQYVLSSSGNLNYKGTPDSIFGALENDAKGRAEHVQ